MPKTQDKQNFQIKHQERISNTAFAFCLRLQCGLAQRWSLLIENVDILLVPALCSIHSYVSKTLFFRHILLPGLRSHAPAPRGICLLNRFHLPAFYRSL